MNPPSQIHQWTPDVHDYQAADYAHLLPPGQEWFSVREAAELLHVSPQYIRDCFEAGKLFGHRHNGRSRRGQEQRRRVHIRRDSLLLYFAESANYDFSLYRLRLLELLDGLPEPWLAEVPELVRVLQQRQGEKNALRRGHGPSVGYAGRRG
ncbi:MAG: hypothetical protein E1N59_1752 [Puniceicoccaceae bacterium 5H]|nr:MAG: hypothetical protein E1N59_1752 [Puniceicoccaceae bacterium 5H]